MKDIKRRIKSVQSTMQITKAMELVASSKSLSIPAKTPFSLSIVKNAIPALFSKSQMILYICIAWQRKLLLLTLN